MNLSNPFATSAWPTAVSSLARPRRNGARARTFLAIAGAALGAAALAVAALTRAADRRHPPTGGFVDVDGVRLHYVERGQGPALVLLHGNGSMVRELELSGLIDLAARQYRVIAFDRPGFGDSTRPGNVEWTAQAQAALFAKALATMGIERATVLGHSWGTMVALALALDHPDRVQGLVLVSGYYFPTFRPDAMLLAAPAWPLVGRVMRHTISPIASRLLWPALVRAAFGPPDTPADIGSLPKWKFLRPSRLAAAGFESGALAREARKLQSRYAALDVPVTILAGAGDRVVGTRHAQRLHAAIPHSELVIVPRAGHMLHHVAPRRVVAAVHRVSSASRVPASRTLDRMGDFPIVSAGLAD